MFLGNAEALEVASLMKDAKQQLTTVILDNNDYKFKVNPSVNLVASG